MYRAAEEFVVIPALPVGMFSILIDTKTDKVLLFLVNQQPGRGAVVVVVWAWLISYTLF